MSSSAIAACERGDDMVVLYDENVAAMNRFVRVIGFSTGS